MCFLQFSALYPEMVQAVVLLDSFGFLPTDQVLSPVFNVSVCVRQALKLAQRPRKCHHIVPKLLNFPAADGGVWLPHLTAQHHFSFSAERNSRSDEAGDGGDASI